MIAETIKAAQGIPVVLRAPSMSWGETLHEVGCGPGLAANPDTTLAFRWTLRAFMKAREIKRLACNLLLA